jgi:cytosine deaminase
VGTSPSRIGKLDGHGRFAVGTPARFIVFNARSINEIVSRPQADRIVIDRGERITEKVPDYAELWHEDPVEVAPTA